MQKTKAKRYHDICAGHRVYGHESKCAHLHGHNYRIHFICESDNLDSVGRVIDFSVIKEKLCMWVENEWDHRFLVWDGDPIGAYLLDIDDQVVRVPFNPTAENMAKYLVEDIGPAVLFGTGVRLTMVDIEETAKCSASYELGEPEYEV
jgi:6-pyruvoyltetrahydropterin/6-carboxytetrahydropterin synthase